ncbi:MAG TPA: hypothetical protein VJ773_05665 [Gemmatimonadales bacterium]|nr:hypothetical protein [Gemmatimonadales bacterium]
MKVQFVEEGALPPDEDDPPIEDYPIVALAKSLPNLSWAINQQNIDTASGALLTATAPAAPAGQPNTDITYARDGLVTSKVERSWQSLSDLWVIAEETTTLYDAAGEPWVRIHFVADEVWLEELGIPQLAEIGYSAQFAKLCVGELLVMAGAGMFSAGVCASSGPLWWVNYNCVTSIMAFIGAAAIWLNCVKGG